MKINSRIKFLFFPLIFGLFSLSSGQVVLTVTTSEDQRDIPPGAEVSLREAIWEAGAGETIIRFDPDLSGATITLGQSLLVSNGGAGLDLTIDGSGLDLPITISGASMRSGEPTLEHFEGKLALNDLVFEEGRNGVIQSVDTERLFLKNIRIRKASTYGVYCENTSVTMTGCEVSETGRTLGTSPLSAAIFCFECPSVIIDRCSIHHNMEGGVSVFNSGFALVRNTTISENISDPESGRIAGLRVGGVQAVSIHFCTIVDNTGGGIGGFTEGGQILASIVARNQASDGSGLQNIEGGITSLGFNILDNSPRQMNAPTDLTNRDPKVSRLGYFCGQVPVCYPLEGSPAISRSALGSVTSPGSDGRGFPRQVSDLGNFLDIGAVEVNTATDLVVTSTAINASGGLNTLLRSAPPASGQPRRITFAGGVSGRTINFTSPLEIEGGRNFVIDGSALSIPVKFTSSGSIFEIKDTASVGFHSLSFRDRATNSSPAIATLDRADLGLSCCRFLDNLGRCLSLKSDGRHLINESVFHNNRQFQPGVAIFVENDGGLEIWNSNFSRNVATGIASVGGAIFHSRSGFAQIVHSTFDRNSAQVGGEAIYTSSPLEVMQSTFSNHPVGGAVMLNDEVKMTACVFYNNQTNRSGEADVVLLGATLDQQEFVKNVTNQSGFAGFDPVLDNAFVSGMQLATFGLYGGKIPSTPFLTTPRKQDSKVLWARDALGQSPLGEEVAVGAVLRQVVTENSSEPRFLAVPRRSGLIWRTRMQAMPGSVWNIEGGTDLIRLTVQGQFSPKSAEAEELVFAGPSGGVDRYFSIMRKAP